MLRLHAGTNERLELWPPVPKRGGDQLALVADAGRSVHAPSLGRYAVCGHLQVAWHAQSSPHAQVAPQQQPDAVGSQAQGVGQVQSAMIVSFATPVA